MEFVNCVRIERDLPILPTLLGADVDPDDAERCFLAQTLEGEIGASPAGEWSVHVGDPAAARVVGICQKLPWSVDPPAVALPECAIDFATATHVGLVEADEIGFVVAWSVPRDADDPSKGLERHVVPGMEAVAEDTEPPMAGAAECG